MQMLYMQVLLTLMDISTISIDLMIMVVPGG